MFSKYDLGLEAAVKHPEVVQLVVFDQEDPIRLEIDIRGAEQDVPVPTTKVGRAVRRASLRVTQTDELYDLGAVVSTPDRSQGSHESSEAYAEALRDYGVEVHPTDVEFFAWFRAFVPVGQGGTREEEEEEEAEEEGSAEVETQGAAPVSLEDAPTEIVLPPEPEEAPKPEPIPKARQVRQRQIRPKAATREILPEVERPPSGEPRWPKHYRPGRILRTTIHHIRRKSGWGTCTYHVECVPNGDLAGYRLIHFEGERRDMPVGRYFRTSRELFQAITGRPRPRTVIERVFDLEKSDPE